MNPTKPGLNWFQRTHAELMSTLDSANAEGARKPVATVARLVPFVFWLFAAVLVAPHLSWPVACFMAVLAIVAGVAFWLIDIVHG